MDDLATVERVVGHVLFWWGVFSAFFNRAIRWKTDAEWIAFCESQPRLAAFVRVVRALGVDPVAFMASLRAFFERQEVRRIEYVLRPSLKPGARPSPPPTPPPPPPRLPPAGFVEMDAAAWLVVLAFVAFLVALTVGAIVD